MAGDVVGSAQPNRRLLPPFGWANVIGETTSIIIIIVNVGRVDLEEFPLFYVDIMIGSLRGILLRSHCFVD